MRRWNSSSRVIENCVAMTIRMCSSSSKSANVQRPAYYRKPHQHHKPTHMLQEEFPVSGFENFRINAGDASGAGVRLYDYYKTAEYVNQLPTIKEKIDFVSPYERPWTRAERTWTLVVCPYVVSSHLILLGLHPSLMIPRKAWALPLVPAYFDCLKYYQYITKTRLVESSLDNYYVGLVPPTASYEIVFRRKLGELAFVCRDRLAVQLRSRDPLAPLHSLESDEACKPVFPDDVDVANDVLFSPKVINLWPDEDPLWQCPGYFVESEETHTYSRVAAKSLSLLDERCKEWDAPPEESAEMWQDCAKAQAIASLFTTLCAQAHTHGFTQYTDVTRPFTSQLMLSNGVDFVFAVGQLNTIAINIECDGFENPKTNVCHVEPPLRLYDDYREGRCLTNELRVFFISDTHLLGERQGHWFDKLRRYFSRLGFSVLPVDVLGVELKWEWQMYRAYQSALHLLAPDAVFFLGDLMDEGQWGDRSTFHKYADRFDSLFRSSSSNGPPVHVLAGNHDIGFHYAVSPSRVEWFEKRFNRSTVDVVVIEGQPFILVTSMALHGDGCRFCYEAERELDEIAKELNCSKLDTCEKNASHRFQSYRRPILLQHFPLFRLNDNECLRDEDFDDDDPNRDDPYRPKWEALSEESTELLLQKLEPRAVFNGHSHRGCKKRWSQPAGGFWEYTVNSFSWRNGNRPTFLMATISEDDVLVGTCHLPNESTVINLYCITAIITVIWILRSLLVARYPGMLRTLRSQPSSSKLIKSG
ncbi:Ser/Thr phosphatase family protein [Ostertagia ostertagi]